MAYQFKKNDDEPRIERLGQVPLLVEEFDRANNTIHGTNLQTGEELSVRMATVEEWAEHFTDRNRHTTQDARMQDAKARTAKQPNVRSMQSNVAGPGVVIQMQGVIRKPDGDVIARWGNAMTTEPEQDAFRRAQIDVRIPTSNEETGGRHDRRYAVVVFTDEAEPASMDALDRMTTNKVTGLEGSTLEGDIRSGVMVAVDNGSEVITDIIQTPYDREKGELIRGGAALLDRPVSNYMNNWQVHTALAAMVDKPLEELKLPEKVNRDDAAALYNAVKAGEIAVAVTPTLHPNMMPSITKEIVGLEKRALEKPTTSRMSGRAFYEADIGFRSLPESHDPKSGKIYAAETKILNIRTTGFLKAESDPTHVATRQNDLGAQSIAKAGGFDALVKQQAAQMTVQAEQKAEAEKTKPSGFAPTASM